MGCCPERHRASRTDRTTSRKHRPDVFQPPPQREGAKPPGVPARAGAPVPVTWSHAPRHTWSFLAVLGHTCSRHWGGADGRAQVAVVCAQVDLTSAERGSLSTLQDTEQKGPRRAWACKDRSPVLGPGLGAMHPQDRSLAKGIEWISVVGKKRSVSRESCRKVSPVLRWQPSRVLPVPGRWLPGLVTV